MDLRTKININGLYEGKKLIIGGGSPFTNTLEKELIDKLKNEIVLGCNYFAQFYPSTWCIVADTYMSHHVKFIKNLMSGKKSLKFALNRTKATPQEILDRAQCVFNGYWLATLDKQFESDILMDFVATAALHIAAYMKAKEVLLLGVDYTKGENALWPDKCQTYNNPIDVNSINNNMRKIINSYNLKVYQANKDARTDFSLIPYKPLEDFINE